MAIRIIWNSNNVDVLINDESIQRAFKVEGNVNRSANGKTETINIYNWGEPVIFNAVFLEAVYRQLLAFWAWAEQGKVFSFNMDSANVGNTTFDAGAAAGQKVCPVAATAAFATSDVVLIRSADRTKYEIGVVASIQDGVSLTMTDNLYYTYASADIVRHWDYYPALILPEGEIFNPMKSGLYYSYSFTFLEQL